MRITTEVFGTVRKLFLAVLVLSVAALVVALCLRANADQVNWVVWLRGTAVAVASVWLVTLAGQAAAGSRRAYLRIRFVSAVAPPGILLIILAPDAGYPAWLKAEQGMVGLLLVWVAILVNRRAVRDAFPKAGKMG